MSTRAEHMAKRTARLGSGSGEWERAKRRRTLADYLDEACGESERSLKGLAACGGVTDTKLRAMRRGDHGADLATVLGLPPRVVDAFMQRVAADQGRAWAEAVEPGTGEWDVMIEQLRKAFEAAHGELREVAREKRLTKERARSLLKPLRVVERLVVGARVLAEKVADEDEEGDR